MADTNSLEGLEGLHRDLRALTELKLPILERVAQELEAKLEAFKVLLDKPRKNDKSRQSLSFGKIQIGEEEYEVNDDFKQQTIEIADALDLDELQSASLFLQAQNESQELDRTQLITAIIRFHRRREFVLSCLHIIAKSCTAGLTSGESGDADDENRSMFQKALAIIVSVEGINFANAYKYWQKCLTTMDDIEKWLHQIAERLQSASVIGQTPAPEFVEIMTFQHGSLTRQHEYLAAICTHMTKIGYVDLNNFKALRNKMKSLDRHDIITIHYIPMAASLIAWAAAETNTNLKDCRSIHKEIMEGRENDNWTLRNLHAAMLVWWLAEYSGRYVDPPSQDPDLQGIKLSEEAEERSKAFMQALNDGAFHFILSFCQDLRPTRWHDPAKSSMLTLLLSDTTVLSSDSARPEDYFQTLVMEQLQSFAEAFITNMPDTLRQLKVEEDDQRKKSHFSRTAGEPVLHLERFLVMISYAYDGCPDAAEEFWNDKEGNLYGFLQWAAKRQPTPRIAAFCEMLRALSTGELNAEQAHIFLIDESSAASGKIKRTGSLSYTLIFNELQEFRRDIHEPKKSIQGNLYPNTQSPGDKIFEVESFVMIESYFRLLAHICRQSHNARTWLLDYEAFNLGGIAFDMCVDRGNQDEPRLRAAAYDTVTALLTNKTTQRANATWELLDDWTSKGLVLGINQGNAIGPASRSQMWTKLASGFDEPNAFIGLLSTLVAPYPDDSGLNDTLPFPENLGGSHRMPGIEEYVDFVLGFAFSRRCLEIQDTAQSNILRWSCLRFIVACLSTFNEDLVVFANKSNIPVDSVIDSSSLIAYVKLHPFSRVMEWLFNDSVLKALFAAAHQDVNEVDSAASNSPLVESLMLSIEVMDLIMKLQATYLDIVRPVISQQSSTQLKAVSNTALASFEDAVLNHLQIIVDLGLYCGTGHEDLTIASLRLLEKLSSSRKLVVSPAGFGQRSGRSKIVGILEKDNEAERISRSLVSLMKQDERELEMGTNAPGYIVKMQILDFIRSCLSAVSTRPTIAHVLLGFDCGSATVRVVDDGLWSNGQSLFHSILELAVLYPDRNAETFVSWMSTLKNRCWDILQKLWKSPLTSSIVLDELRTNELLFCQAIKLPVVDAGTPWDCFPLAVGIEDEQVHQGLSEFFYGEPAIALQNFLQERGAFLDYECRELRSVSRENMPSLKARIQSTLLGNTTFPEQGREPHRNPSIFDLFDFIELDIPDHGIFNQHPLLQGINLDICTEDKDGVQLFEMGLIKQLLILRLKSLKKDGVFRDEQDEARKSDEANELIVRFIDHNRRSLLIQYQKDVLRSWVQLLVVSLQSFEFEVGTQTSFILQALQKILPKLKSAYDNDIFVALQLASLAEALIYKIDFNSSAFEKTRTGDFANDGLFQLFGLALEGIYSPVSTAELREFCYQICFRYIHGTFEKATTGSALGRHTLNTVKNCNSHLIEVICDDAYSGQGTCKVSALLLLDAFVAMATRQESKYILDSFVSLNFIGVLVDNIKHIPGELKAAAASQVDVLLSYYDASLALLLRICQARVGAAHVLNAGLFQSIRESNIFSVDPDIGLEFENPEALKKYFELMLAVLRVINSAVISRGRQNDQTVFQAREFLRENRHSMVSVFKRSVNVGGGQDIGLDLTDLVDCFTVLVEITGFLEYEDKTALKGSGSRQNLFS